MELLIAATAFALLGTLTCSLFEAVLLSVPGDHVEALARQGHAAGLTLKRLRQDMQQPIAAILIVNTLATSGAGAIAGAMVLVTFGAAYVTPFSLVFCLVLLVVAEVGPKTAGVVYSRTLARWVARPLNALVWVLKPLVVALRFVTGLVGGFPRDAAHTVTAEELVVMARLGHQHGVIDEQEAEVIENIIALGRTRVRDLMVPRSVSLRLRADMTVDEAVRLPEVLATSRILVTDTSSPDAVVGVVLRRHILREAAADHGGRVIAELMQPPFFVADSDRLDGVLKRLIERRQYLFAVLDEFGNDVGVITLESILEQILGRELGEDDGRGRDLRELASLRRRATLAAQDEAQPRPPGEI